MKKKTRVYKNLGSFSVRESTLELRKDTEALKLLGELVELASVPPERGGSHFSDWERDYIASMSVIQPPVFSEAQRAKIKEIWQAADLRKRGPPRREDGEPIF